MTLTRILQLRSILDLHSMGLVSGGKHLEMTALIRQGVCVTAQIALIHPGPVNTAPIALNPKK